MLRITASDGELSSSEHSDRLDLYNERQIVLDNVFLNVTGDGQGPLAVHLIDFFDLTEHTYQLSFKNGPSPDTLHYEVYDRDISQIVVQNAFETFGAEGPLFDGIRLSVFNFDDVSAWKTEWTNVVSETSNYMPEFKFWQVREPADYEVRFMGEGADTSFIGDKTVPFQIWNITQSPERKVNIIIIPSSGAWSSGDIIAFLEPDLSHRTWSLSFTWNDSFAIAPKMGDILTLYTGRPYETGDELYFNTKGRPIGVGRKWKLIPLTISLSQNYPNPFNPTTILEYSIPKSEEVSLIVYNLLGEEVVKLVNRRLDAGFHRVSWNASNMASGIYFYRLQAGDFVQTRKMVLLK
ncbi:T9SS type A sorting domain-containing protein [Candidatus Marinimicrobia bacterium MT.SAG.2]|nr:T9SS type A sorting domain-containing protein [Candidatus Marinimicrobia bacterium MT.SAG.2]